MQVSHLSTVIWLFIPTKINVNKNQTEKLVAHNKKVIDKIAKIWLQLKFWTFVYYFLLKILRVTFVLRIAHTLDFPYAHLLCQNYWFSIPNNPGIYFIKEKKGWMHNSNQNQRQLGLIIGIVETYRISDYYW